MNEPGLWQTREASSLIDAFTRDLAQFVSGLTGVAGSVHQKSVRPEMRMRYFYHASGAAISVPIDRDCYYCGCALLYTSGQLTVTVNGDNQTAVVSGATGRELNQVIGMAGTTADSLGKMRTLLHSGSILTICTNTGPLTSGHLFEMIS